MRLNTEIERLKEESTTLRRREIDLSREIENLLVEKSDLINSKNNSSALNEKINRQIKELEDRI